MKSLYIMKRSGGFFFSSTSLIILENCFILRCIESNSRLLWFCISTLSDWFENLVPLSRPLRSETKTNRGSFEHVYPRFTPVISNCFDF